MDERYRLEIHEEDDPDTSVFTFYSNEPFLAISVGDLINPGSFELWDGRKRDGTWMLEVTSLDHLIWGIVGTNMKHSISLYTRYVPNEPDTRPKR